jgi:hypothetical protein
LAVEPVEPPVPISMPLVGLRERLERALTDVGEASYRLSTARTTVAFVVTDDPASSVTLLLDRDPPCIASDDEPAEITIELTAAQALRFASAELHLPLALMAGEVTARGPVRKYLARDPVLRALLRRDR